jgi:hypothetical protein
VAVKSIPLAIVNFKSTNQPLRAVRYFADPKKVVGTVDCLRIGTISNATPKEIEQSLLCDHHDRHVKARVCRTVIISVQTPNKATKEQIDDLVKRTENAFRDLFKELNVPGAAWIHGNTKTIHGHGIFPNSDGQRTLNITPNILRTLQDFKWTEDLDSGRGKGERGALPVYPKAKHLAVRTLAELIFDNKNEIGEKELSLLEKDAVITEVRRKTNGEAISFLFRDKRFRFTTLKRYAKENQQKGNRMITTFDPDKETPPELMNELTKIGFKPDKLKKLFEEINSVRQLTRVDKADKEKKPKIGGLE